MAKDKSLPQIMIELRGYIPKEPGEANEAYRQRLHGIARLLLDEQQARAEAEAVRPVHNLTIKQELNSSNQTRLQHTKYKYARD